MNEVKDFYEQLYSIDENVEGVVLNDFLDGLDVPRLNMTESANLEGLITLKEASQTLKNMKNNKSPGSDGFTSEFFKCFWKQLGTFVIRALNYGFLIDELSITQRLGIITCIPKANKSKKNYKKLETYFIVKYCV